MEKTKLELELLKEIELESEKERLKEVVNLINGEILDYIDKRKFITKQILDYREEILEEYRNDEDKVAEYFDHERYVKEESFKLIDKRLNELTVLKNSPYFGRVDFKDDDSEGEEKIYIGRFGITTKESLEPLIIDWRAPIASMFYTAKLGHFSFIAPGGDINTEVLHKRQYIIKKQKLLGMFDSEMDVKDEVLQMVLSSNSGEKLKDIIMTIQAEQDTIIRKGKYDTVVVNGVAGSGKTTIALHRVAYLLYNFRESLHDKVLILGPNSIFMDYISMVLPSLGEVGVSQTTFQNLAEDILKLDSVIDFKTYMESILASESDFIQNHNRKISSRFIFELDELIQNINSDYIKIQNVNYLDKVVVSAEEIEELFKKYYISMPLFRRTKKIRRIIYSKLREYRDELVREINRKYNEKINSMTEEEHNLKETNVRYMWKLEIREVVSNIIKAKKSMNWINNEEIVTIYNRFNCERQLTIDDMAPILYLKMKLEGLKYAKEIRHIVIDEAQDFSELQFRVIREITGCKAFTIVGDVRQRLLPGDDIAMLNLKDIYKDLGIENFDLNKSYRSTKEIMTFANKYLGITSEVPIIRSGSQVEEVNLTNEVELKKEIISTIEAYKKNDYESIGIICRDLKDTERAAKLLLDTEYIKVFSEENMFYSGGVMLIPSYFAKGLEFDAAIVLNFNSNKNDGHLNYVMATRALHELSVMNLD